MNKIIALASSVALSSAIKLQADSAASGCQLGDPEIKNGVQNMFSLIKDASGSQGEQITGSELDQGLKYLMYGMNLITAEDFKHVRELFTNVDAADGSRDNMVTLD